jgi:hypothetical protein
MLNSRLILLLLILFLIVSCKRSEPVPDVKNIKADLEIKRFEKDLFAADPARINSSLDDLKAKYNRFIRVFSQRIINIGSENNPYYAERLKHFITDYTNYRIYEKTSEVFSDIKPLEQELEQAFRFYLHYFPEKQVPEVITYISGFNQSVISDSNLLAIGLDKYLGREEEMYDLLGIYTYLRVNMHKEKIPSDCMRLWAMTEFPFNDSVNHLVSNLIYEGMVMYFVDRTLPRQPDTLKWGFTKQQLEFCRDNEKQMWTYLIEHKLLFVSDKFTINKFILEGPFTKDFTTASPARAAVWLGYKIVKSYANKNKVSFHDLMHERDYLKILNLSGYNP